MIGKDLDPRVRAELHRGDRPPRHRFRRAGGRDAVDHAGLENGQLVPRPFILRLLLAKTDDGWRVMPGGFVRIADDLDARAVSLQQGGRTADAWILSDKPVAQTSLLPAPDRITINRTHRRAAEPRGRQPVLARPLCRARRGDAAPGSRAGQPRLRDRPRRGRAQRATSSGLLRVWDAVPEDFLNARPALVAASALQQRELSGALPMLAGAAQSAASAIRDRFSPDAWRALTDMVEMIRAPFEQGPSESAIFDRVNGALRIIASFSGLAQENMSQLAGWRFLELGRRIERTLATCRFIRQFAFGTPADGSLDVLLELCRQPDHLPASLCDGGGARRR